MPIPWAHDDRPHLCQRATSPDTIHVIYERVEGNTLAGDCLPLSCWATVPSVAAQLGADPNRLVLLGLESNHDHRPLREGDILHLLSTEVMGSSVMCRPSAASMLALALIAAFSNEHTTRSRLLPVLAAALLFPGADAGPEPGEPGASPITGWVWSPYRGKLGPLSNVDESPVSFFRDSEPWWPDTLVKINPSPAPFEVHWAPQSPSPIFANVLAIGTPAPIALLLPSRLPKRSLTALISQQFPHTAYLSGQVPSLAAHTPADTVVQLRDGDAIVVHDTHWKPAIWHATQQAFPSHASARHRGCWSHALSFRSNCWLLLWRPGQHGPEVVYAEGLQTWDPIARTLRPALQPLPDGWWPSAYGGSSLKEPLHLATASLPQCANVIVPHCLACIQVPTDIASRLRDGDVLGDSSLPGIHKDIPISPGKEAAATGRARRRTSPHLATLFLGIHCSSATARWVATGSIAWSLLWLSSYLPAYQKLQQIARGFLT